MKIFKWVERHNPILDALNEIKEILKTMGTSQAQLDAALQANIAVEQALKATVVTLNTLVQQIIAKAEAGGIDLTQEKTAVDAATADLQGVQDSVTSVNTNLTAAITPPAAS